MNRPHNKRDDDKDEKAGDITAHAAIPPGDDNTPDDTPDEALKDRPGEDLLESEGEALLPPSEEIRRDTTRTALPVDETVLASTLDAHDPDALPEPMSVEDGDLVRQLEDMFPLVWLAMLLTVCYIAIYFAIEQLPNRANPLPGPDMFF